MSKATEPQLSKLHEAVAKVLTDQVLHEEDETVFNQDGIEVPTGNTRYTVAPATISAAIKFLKDNDITTDIEKDDNMSKLKDALDRKQKHSRLKDAKASVTKLYE